MVLNPHPCVNTFKYKMFQFRIRSQKPHAILLLIPLIALYIDNGVGIMMIFFVAHPKTVCMSIWIVLSIWMSIRIRFLFDNRFVSCLTFWFRSESCFPFIRTLFSMCVDPGPAFHLDTNPDLAFLFLLFSNYMSMRIPFPFGCRPKSRSQLKSGKLWSTGPVEVLSVRYLTPFSTSL